MGIQAKVCCNDVAKKEKQAISKCIHIAYFRWTKLIISLQIWCSDTTATSFPTNTRGRHSLAMHLSIHVEVPTYPNIWPSPLDALWPASVFLLTSWDLRGAQRKRDEWVKRHDENSHHNQVHLSLMTLNESWFEAERQLVQQAFIAVAVIQYNTIHPLNCWTFFLKVP